MLCSKVVLAEVVKSGWIRDIFSLTDELDVVGERKEALRITLRFVAGQLDRGQCIYLDGRQRNSSGNGNQVGHINLKCPIDIQMEMSSRQQFLVLRYKEIMYQFIFLAKVSMTAHFSVCQELFFYKQKCFTIFIIISYLCFFTEILVHILLPFCSGPSGL